MSLDLSKVAAQVVNMISRLKEGRADRQQRLQNSFITLTSEAIDLDDLKKKIEASKTSWLVAELTDGLGKRYPAPLVPGDFTVIATDGSHIEVDRHHATRCYLINIGAVAISYGKTPDARLTSTPRLYADEKDMVITPPGGGREYPLDANLLGIKRSVEEWRHLTELAASVPSDSPCLALLDGTLIQWGLEGYPDFVADALLADGFLRCLDEMKSLNGDRRLAVASYISFPGGTDVANALKVAVCPHEVADCDRCCPPGHPRECDAVSGVRDRELFTSLLAEGERSALFISPSKIVKERYGEHRVYFYYVKLADEVARIEIPQWVAENEELCGLGHGLVLDQCRRGHGYPVVLSEAHEQAVVTGADRENFWELVEATLAAERLPSSGSAKSLSKRTRWV